MATHHAERADAYLHGLLSPEESTAFERDLADDAALRAALDVARRRLALLEAALPPAEASEVLVRHTLELIGQDAERRRRWHRRAYALAFAPIAACALIIGLFHTHYSTLSASPVDLEVYGQETLMPGSAGALRVRLIDKSTQAPLSGVPVEVTLGEPGSANFMTLASFTTDAHGNGQPAFRLPDWADGSYALRITAQTPKQPEVVTQSVHLKRSAKLLLTSDKPVYQPGQTIHLRALTLMRPDLKPAADAETAFTITDPRGNIIFRRGERTSRFGIAAADCALATELIEGDYRIACRVGDTDSALNVRVEKYVLPKIRLAISTDKSWYQPGDEVRGTLTATYHHGEPAANAEWALEATESHGRLLAKLSGRTDDRGRATFGFRMEEGAEISVAIAAQVRDTAGQAQTAKLERRVDRTPFRLTVIPEGGSLVPGVPNRVYLYTQRPDGAPIAAKGTVKIRGGVWLVSPDLPEENVKKEQWSIESTATAVRPIATGDLGISVFTITPSDAPPTFDFDLTDALRGHVQQTVSLPSGLASVDYIVRTDKAVYTSGDTMHLTVLATGSGPVFLDILKDDQTFRSDIIDVKDGRGELAFDIPAELVGTLQLCSYRFDAYGRPARKTRTLFVRPAKQLQVQMKQPKAEFRPGEKGKLEFTLTDERGRPTPGALSLAMVDEAVFDVRQSLPGLERTFYLLEQKLLAPTATLYPWTPDANLGGDAQQRGLLEQAIFALTATAGEGIKTRAQTVPLPPQHTLTAATFPAKQQAADRDRANGLHWVHLTWGLFGLSVGFALYVLMWRNVRWPHMLLLHGVVAVLLAMGGLVVLVALVDTRPGATFSTGGRPDQTAEAMMAPGADKAVEGVEGTPKDLSAIRVRDRFPETMLWQPQLITDDAGHASLELEFADSITTWRLSGGAVSADGRLGSLQSGLRVFQPFFVDLNLPVALTRGDEIDVPAVVSNFLPQAQAVELALTKADWFELVGADSQKLELKPREVRSVSFRLRVINVGKYKLRVTARSRELGDAVERDIEVVPDGRRVEQITNGQLNRPATIKLDLPTDAIPGSGKAIVRIYPSGFSQLVDGLDGIFRLPTGCFEQTSSSLYPNVLALSYLRQFSMRLPHVEATAPGYIHTGYQRLLTFETPSGGFDWYGQPPGKVALTAYGQTAFLVIRRDDGFGDVFQLRAGQRCTIGRATSNRVVLKDEMCSREHAEVLFADQRWYLKDLGSLNGTRVNLRTVRDEEPLKPQDVVELGNTQLVFVDTMAQLPDMPAKLPAAPDSKLEIRVRLSETQFGETDDHMTDRTVVTQSHTTPSRAVEGHLSRLYRLALAMGASETEDDLVQLVLDGLMDLVKAEVGAVLFLNDGNELSLRAHRHREGSFPKYQKVSQYVSNEVVSTKQAILAEDVAADRHLRIRESLTDLQVSSLICTPVMFRGHLYGIVHLYSLDPKKRLDRDDLDLSLAVANQFAMALFQQQRRARMEASNRLMRDQLKVESKLVGSSEALKKIESQIGRVAETNATVLIRGESGVGKELVARALHENSPRRDGPFVTINCAALTESLLESELFGHEKGAFTGATERMAGKFESAHQGTIFLDEIGEMAPNTQAKFLRVLEGHVFERVGGNVPIKVDVRVVAATNRPLEEAVRAGKFRRDLFFRLQVVEMQVAPLRERKGDIAILAEHFLTKFVKETGRRFKGFTGEALAKLNAYHWPGNVRELRNVIERAVALASGPHLDGSDIWLSSLEAAIPAASASNDTFVPVSLEDMEKRYILRTLQFTQWNKSQAATILGIERSTLDRKIKAYELKRE